MVYNMPYFMEMLIPLGAQNRTGKLMQPGPRFVTIHETSLGTKIQPAEKDVQHYIDRVMHPPEEKSIGYHYLVTDKLVIRFVKDHEFTCHAGILGNKVSIGVERIVNVNTDALIAVANQAMVAATLMKKHSIPLKNVVPHKYWTNKECPARLLAGMFGGWDGFVEQVDKFYREEQFILELF